MAWDRIPFPKKSGGWGIRDVFWVYQALHQSLTHSGLWGLIMQDKYLEGIFVIDWIRLPQKKLVGTLNIWRGLLEVFPLLNEFLVWQVGDGFQTRLGVDPIIGCNILLSHPTLNSLHHNGIFFLN